MEKGRSRSLTNDDRVIDKNTEQEEAPIIKADRFSVMADQHEKARNFDSAIKFNDFASE